MAKNYHIKKERKSIKKRAIIGLIWNI